MASRSASLQRRFPHRVDIPLLLIASGMLMTWGLITPAVETRALFWRNEYSIILNLKQMSDEGRHVAAAIIAACSIVYPFSKLGLLMFFWLFPFPARGRWRSIQFVRFFGRWSMVDVFTMTTIILASTTYGPLHATPRPGLFLYASGVSALSISALLMDRMSRVRR